MSSPTGASLTDDPTSATNATTATTMTGATSASTSGGTFGDDTTGDGTDGPSFIMVPDGGSQCSLLLQCDIWAQDCMDGEKCMPWACGDHAGWNASRCSAMVDDPAQPGEPCTVVDGPFSGVDDCALSSMCWNPDPDTLVGECVAFCSGTQANPGCEDPSLVCYQGYDGDLIACLPPCDPLLGDCDGGEQCMFDQNGSGFVCMPDFLIGAQSYGDDCEGLIGCGTGLVCRPAADVPGCATAECCTTLGDLDEPVECPDASQVCISLGLGPPVHYDLCYCGVDA
jgi:hypothetical protein